MDQDLLRTNIDQLEEVIQNLTEAQASLKALLVEEERDVIMDMREFLHRFSMELRAHGVNPAMLQRQHVPPLIKFMRKQGITRLVSGGQARRGWFLASDGEFKNPFARGLIKEGNIKDLDHLGRVFEGQNGYIQ